MHAGVLRHVGRDGRRRSGRSRATRPTASTCCASSATTAGPPTTPPTDEYEGLTITPVGIDPRYCPDYLLAGRPPANATGCSNWARSTATATPRSRCIAPTGTIGLVMDCDTTGIEPDFALVKFKKLAGGGYFKIINASIPPALARLGYTPQQIEDIVRYCRGAGTLNGCPHINRASLKAKGFTDDVLQTHRGAAARRLRAALRLQPLDLGDDFLTGQARLHRGADSTRPASTCSTALGFTPRADRRGQRLRLRHHDHRGGPAPEARALSGLRLRQQVRQDGQRFLSAESHIRMMAAAQPFISGAISQDDQHAARRDRRGRQEGVPAQLAADAQGQRPVPRRLEAEPAAQHRRRRPGPGRRAAADGTEAEGRAGADRGEDRPPLHRPAAAGCPTAGPATRRRPASATTRSTCAPASTRTARSARSSSTCTRKGPPSAA